ncbi:hypothetical protein A5886_001813 [Enterococcus sp. 8G7_MSG3316]|uniref:Phage minor capsid protein 2 n=1 Tax=Candidatus Enterococcus testudinis TaxID=1834191 RepID=A0A242A6T3_9ENTE|nr:phage minor capsid protein [Enterococcus sp. 8G7_MSG3316]OTN76734.1 hypothetical protein A5886_001813 [Enterococcus sp. 8G7_MSG3316]
MSITPKQLDIQAAYIQDAYMALEDELIKMLIRQLNAPTRTLLTKSTQLRWKLEKMNQLNMLNDKTITEIVEQTSSYSYEQMRKLVIDMGFEVVKDFDGQVYKQTGSVLVNGMEDTLESIFNQQWLEIDNHVNQTLINTNYPNNPLSKAYQQVLNDIVAKVTTGLITPEEAFRKGIYEWVDRGIMSSFIDKGGREWSLERYVRMVLRTTTHRTFNDLRLKRGLEHGIVTAIMSEHPAARPACAHIQGGWVLLVPTAEAPAELQHIKSIHDHGYGTPSGTQGINCMHRLYIQIYDPMIVIEKKYNAKEAIDNAEIVAKQRKMEVAIRNAKKRLNAAKELGDKEGELYFSKLVRKRQASLREYIAEHKTLLHRDYSREQVYSPVSGSDKAHWQNIIDQDKSEYKRVAELNASNLPNSLEDFRRIKYNESEEFARLERRTRTLGEIESKSWSLEFKNKTREAYDEFLKQGFEFSSHALSRFVQRSDITVEYASVILNKRPNYVQADGRKVWYFDGNTFILNDTETEVVTYVFRKNPKADWKEL